MDLGVGGKTVKVETEGVGALTSLLHIRWAALIATLSSGVLMSWYPVNFASMLGQKGIIPLARLSA